MSTNLVEDLTGVDAFSRDVIAAAVIGEHAPWSRPNAERLGRAVWDPATLAAARDAHRHLPELRAHDRLGRRIDVVEFHPAYHELMAMAFGHGVHALAWTASQPGAHLARAVQSYLWNQVDGATACPTGMAYAGRHSERHRHPAAQGQARQPGQRVLGDRVPRRLRDRGG
jgi:putative acyl-CoA dehydrogenase